MELGWIDFSKEDKNRVLSVLKLLTEPGAVDELGIGIIRDGFADILFPGTSTIQTRAKYLFLVPNIAMELEREKKLKPHEFIEKLEQEELKLIDILDSNDAKGIIGKDAREKLKRKPSSIYWNAFKTYGFFTEQSLSLSEYANVFCKLRDNAMLQKSSGNNYRENAESFDDLDIAQTGANFWRVPKPNINWRDNLTIDLSFDEAKYLMQKIKTMPKTKDTLFALILNENIEEFVNFESFNDLDGVMSIMTPEIRRDYEMARDFSRFIFGSQIRYNVIFSKGENETANDLWGEWQDNIPNINLEEIFIRLSVKNNNLKHFLRQYQSLITDTPKLDDLIINREKQLKGSSRAKLVNDKLYSYKEQTINMYQLSYRMFNTQTIVKDIFEGVCQDA